jgi:hypothetical protein
MTFLELVLRTRLECRSSGAAPDTVVDLSGMNKKFVNWVAQAWIEIQSSQEYWKFMRQEFSFPVVAGVAEYPPYAQVGDHANLADFRFWHEDTFRLYLTASGLVDEQLLAYEPDYDGFRNCFRYGVRQPGRPGLFTLRPRDEAVMFDVTPEAAYTCVGDYQIEPVLLVANDDTPVVDDRFHMLVVYGAMEKYGVDQAAAEVIARARLEKAPLMGEFERKYLPKVSM